MRPAGGRRSCACDPWSAPPHRRTRARLPQGLLAAALVLLAAGCAARRPAKGPPQPRPAPGYEARVDGFGVVDTTRLRGRRIALDPGHGGWFRGSLGVNGLAESEVNLGVALHLRGLLEARGAMVMMTRTDDRDFLTPADSSLRADLAERMRLANLFEPDLFVSIHHNADAGGAHDVNETQTYYTLGDEGPSLDAAESVHRFLVRNLGIRRHRIVPGNYFVLRNASAPALLTESSYLTNPDVEAKLALAAKQRLEAEALYLGIAHYFARGAPVIESFVASASPGGVADSVFHDVGAPVFEARVEGAFDEAAFTIDGVPVRLDRFGPALSFHPGEPLALGAHEAVLRVRRAGAAAATPARIAFRIHAPVGEVRAIAWPGLGGPADLPAAIRLEFRDRLGRFVRDSMAVTVAWRGRDAGAESLARDGVAWIYLPRRGDASPDLTVHVAGDTSTGWSVSVTDASPRPGWPVAGFATRITGRDADGRLQTEPLAGVRGTEEPARRIPWLTRDGFAALPRDSGGTPQVPRLAGFRRSPEGGLAFIPIASGALHGRRVVLDPDGGGDESGGTGPSGTRGAHVNLRIARILRGFLEAAGAEVRLTRDGDYALSEVERVRISEAFGAERYLRIGHRAAPPRLGHFFSSTAGLAWGRRTAEALSRLGKPAPPVAEDAQYPLQQTSCPALFVSAARIDDAAAEDALLAPGALRTEAYALYLALLGEWATDAAPPLDSLFVRDQAGRPVAGAAVLLGDAIMLETDREGRVRFARTEPGPLDAAVVDPRVAARAILLESASGAILTGPRGRP